MAKAGAELDNDPSNLCIGCGPANPVGLHLRFARHGDEVTSQLEATRHREGWPDRLHSGVLYIAMLEVANWTVFGLKGRAALPVKTGHPAFLKWVPTGEAVTLAGRIATDAGSRLTVRVEARDTKRDVVAHVEREFELVDQRELMRRLGYERLPAVLEGLFPR
jgi:hypothetical protein